MSRRYTQVLLAITAVLVVPVVLSAGSVALNSFTDGSVASAADVNANFAAINTELGRGRLCILKEVRTDTNHSGIVTENNIWYTRRPTTTEGFCDYLTPGTKIAGANYKGGEYFTSFTLAPGKYFVRIMSTCGQDTYSNLLRLVNETAGTEAVRSMSVYANGSGAINMHLIGKGFIELAAPASFRLEQIHSSGTTAVHGAGHVHSFGGDQIYSMIEVDKVE